MTRVSEDIKGIQTRIKSGNLDPKNSLDHLEHLLEYVNALFEELDDIKAAEKEMNTLIKNKDIRKVKEKEQEILKNVSDLADLFAKL
jgi:hypothetical protein